MGAAAATVPSSYFLSGGQAFAGQAQASVQAITGDGHETILQGSAVQELSDSLRGVLLQNGDDGYDHARAVWNAMINKSPALIARCEGPADTAFPHRSAHCNMMRWNSWFDPETHEQRAQRIADVKADWAILEPFTHGFYVNLNDDSEKITHTNYGPNYDRLVEVKNKYDPTNLLKLNANIKPTIKS